MFAEGVAKIPTVFFKSYSVALSTLKIFMNYLYQKNLALLGLLVYVKLVQQSNQTTQANKYPIFKESSKTSRVVTIKASYLQRQYFRICGCVLAIHSG